MAAAMLVLISTPGWAQSLEITPLVSFSGAAPIDRTAAGVDDLTMDRSVSWGVAVGYFVSPHVAVEVVSTYTSTDLSMSTSAGSAALFGMHRTQIHANVVYEVGAGGLPASPFLFGGFGATRFSADGVPSQTKPSWTAGGGLKWFVRPHVGVEVRGGFTSVVINEGGSTFCGPFGFCQNSLGHIELAGGAAFRF